MTANPPASGAWARIWAAFKSQWLASVLIIPLLLLSLNAYVTRQEAGHSRLQGVNASIVTDFQQSGKKLDEAVAAYLDSLAEYGLAERGLSDDQMKPGLTKAEAAKNVVAARVDLRRAFRTHAADVQALRGVIEPSASAAYLSALSNLKDMAERRPDIFATKENIEIFAKLVVERNRLADIAIKRIT